MKLWMRKIFVVLIAVMTLGLYIPPISIDADAESKEVDSTKASPADDIYTPITEDKHTNVLNVTLNQNGNVIDPYDYRIDTLTLQAKEQAYNKLGPRIARQIEVDFTTEILPQMEQVLKMILTEAEEDSIYYGITEHPQQGYGEKIFNIYDYRTKTDIARFHVRRDNRPTEGYWFNFHYHLSEDGFEEHHEIGEIYWDKNTPPKWMS